MLSLDIEIVVPGHGPVGGKEMIEEYFRFFQETEAEILRYHHQGLTVNEMARQSKVVHYFAAGESQAAAQNESWINNQYKNGCGRLERSCEKNNLREEA